ncbi:MAG: FAD-dependent oxidoreductase [Nitrososphaeria archaeon]
MEKIVIIGGGIAGTTAAISARKNNGNAQIQLIDQEKYVQYSRCGLPYLISEEVKEWNELIQQDEDVLKNKFRIQLRLSTLVKKVDVSNNRLIVADPRGSEMILDYTRLIFATGSIPIRPMVKGINLENIFEMRRIEDALNIIDSVKRKRKAVIIGGGLVSVETAEAITKAGGEVTMIFCEDELLSLIFDEYIGRMIRNKLEEKGVEVLPSSRIEQFYGINKVEAVKADGRIFPCDFVILATGVKPNTDLAREAGIPLGKYEGIIVDKRMETKVDKVYAAGDCVEINNFITNESIPIQLATTAYREGEVAGENASGGNRRIQNMISNVCAKIFDVELASVGITYRDAIKNRIDVSRSIVETEDKIEYFPTKKKLWTSLLFDAKDNRLIGAQFAGEKAATWGNFAALAILKEMNIDELADFNTSYSPVVENFWTGITTAARKLRSQQRNV